jgi:hypothetical protein
VGLLHVGHYEGSLHEGFILKDVRITGLTYFPDALLRIQEIHVRLPLYLQGFVSDIDLTIQGPLSSPNVRGHFLIDNVRYRSVFLTDGFSRLNLGLIPDTSQIQVKGVIILDSGLVNVRKINLQLQTSKFVFKGDIFNPTIDIHLGSKVEDMNINLAIKGTPANPQLIVTGLLQLLHLMEFPQLNWRKIF